MLNGSPHEKGCTYTALKEVANVLNKKGIESEIFWVGNAPVAGCIGCGNCFKTGRCFREDGVNEFVEKAKAADGFLFGSPVHYASASGAITSFLGGPGPLCASLPPRLPRPAVQVRRPRSTN